MGDERAGAPIPSGVVTFLFTDVEGSTALWAADAAAMSASLQVHDDLLRTNLEDFGGYVFTTAGDAFCAAFVRASDAVTAAETIQRSLAEVVWPGPELRVRIGIHLGEAEERDGDYFGPVVNTTARVQSAGHGGQVLLSEAVNSTANIQARDLGEHLLKDVPRPLRIFQLGPNEFPPLRALSSTGSNLPAAPNRLIGRDADVRTVRMLLAEHRLVTLMAVGGTGKTRLAIEIADQELPHWRDGVWFVDLTKAGTDQDVTAEVARSIGLKVEGGDVTAQIAAFVAGQSLLMVLDNCEHVIDECAQLVETILTEKGASKILATSREWLDIPFERVHQVPSLATDDNGAAVRLFIERARASNPAFDAGDPALIAEICTRLDGMPLAIELAAARVSVLSLDQLLEGLSDRFRLLSGGRRRQRGRTLEATIDWSHDLLEPDEQQFFRRLGVFLGSFDIAAAACIADTSPADATDLVEALVARSLVARSHQSSGRFQLLETLKAYAEDRLLGAGESDVTRNRHIEYFNALARARTPFELIDRRRMMDLVVDVPNLVAAYEWLEADQRWEELAPLLAQLSQIDYTTASFSMRRLQRCIEQVGDSETVDQLRFAECIAAAHAGDWPTFVAAARAMRSSADPRTVAFGHLYRSMVTVFVDPARAMEEVDRFVALCQPDPTGEAHAEALAVRCVLAASSYDLDAARRLAQQAREAYAGLESRTTTWLNTRYITAVLAWIDGDMSGVEAALAEVEETFTPAIWRETGTRLVAGFARALVWLGPLPSATDPSQVNQEVRDYLIECTSGRVAMMESDGLVVLALIALREQDIARARELLEAAALPRSQGSYLLAAHLAELVGGRRAYERRYTGRRRGDSEWYVERPRGALRAELERREWL